MFSWNQGFRINILLEPRFQSKYSPRTKVLKYYSSGSKAWEWKFSGRFVGRWFQILVLWLRTVLTPAYISFSGKSPEQMKRLVLILGLEKFRVQLSSISGPKKLVPSGIKTSNPFFRFPLSFLHNCVRELLST